MTSQCSVTEMLQNQSKEGLIVQEAYDQPVNRKSAVCYRNVKLKNEPIYSWLDLDHDKEDLIVQRGYDQCSVTAAKIWLIEAF